MNPYLKPERLEFIITDACTSDCRHCSHGGQLGGRGNGGCIDRDIAVGAVRALAPELHSVMTFGGEPLLYPETVCAIHRTAAECGVPSRQLITNGYFTKDAEVRRRTAAALRDAGVNDLLLSVDAFHAEFIPWEVQADFAEALLAAGVPTKLSPAWLGGRGAVNRYNDETERLLERFTKLGLPVGEGNDISPDGNAAVYLKDSFPPFSPDLTAKCGETPYTDPPDRLRSLSVEADGDVVACSFAIGDLHKSSINDIIERYDPSSDPWLCALRKDGVSGLVRTAERDGVTVDVRAYASACAVCRALMEARRQKESGARRS